MQSVEKEISISITKIFNWPVSRANSSFELEFFSFKTATSIIKKAVRGEFHSNAMILNSPLKISYTDDENVITMTLTHLQEDRKEVLGEFQIDLDALRKKAIQYFPFGQENVLQINIFTAKPIAQSRSLYPREEDNQNFIREKETFLERKIHKGDTKIKKSFSEKVFNLLKQVQQIKGGKQQSNKYRSQYEYDNPSISKSISQKRFRPVAFKTQQFKPKTNRSQKHKLILNTLNIVPSDQYYTKQPQQRQFPRTYQPKYQYQQRFAKTYNAY